MIFRLESGIFRMMKFDEKLLRTGVSQIAVLLIAGSIAEAVFVDDEMRTAITGAIIGVILMFFAVCDFRR